MQLKRYPTKMSLKKAMKNYMNWTDVFEFLRERGILVSAFSKEDYAKTGMNFYFSRATYLDLKQRLDGEINYIKSSRYYIPKEKIDDLKESLSVLTGKKIGSDNTKVTLIDKSDDTWEFHINYIESKPGMISLLDETEKQISVTINNHETFTSLDFNLESANDHKKVTEILTLLQNDNPDVQFSLSDIELDKLSSNNKIALFNEFFDSKNSEWELKKILKLKVNRHTKNINKLQKLEQDLLQGINSALLDGENLIENQFVENITKRDFHFTMASMRYDSKITAEFIDFSVEFKTRPARFEAKITNSGEYEEAENGMKENKKTFKKDRQNIIIFEFQNEFYNIYKKLLLQQKEETPELSGLLEIVDETAASEENE
ncbi:hypothetical protein P8868_17000 [Bacillus inaquosorum]|uniref:hypothetical protein n=1 Tax=Bacillus subtilis group TaxID=653685 RepID=UPI000B52F851|nr:MULTISPECIES: hypothetical protein [Bacillus subtilis group]MCY8373365.1 hypothetical protein [Bacillus inaquosorum]MEC0559253.1 hypothetical protein [Bacillus inaquosorum]OWV38910.1 hypothetical protein CE489_05535 [Bacillus spizizenii]